MAGTAAGIAKANAAKALKRHLRDQARLEAARAARGEAPAPTSATKPTNEPAELVENGCSSLMLVDAPATTVAAHGQVLATQLVDSLAPVAVQELASAMRQRKSPSLRFAAACKVLDLSLGRDRDRGAGGEGEDAMLERISGALQLRARAAAAVDAVPIGGDVVAPASSDHSTRQPDTPSE